MTKLQQLKALIEICLCNAEFIIRIILSISLKIRYIWSDIEQFHQWSQERIGESQKKNLVG